MRSIPKFSYILSFIIVTVLLTACGERDNGEDFASERDRPALVTSPLTVPEAVDMAIAAAEVVDGGIVSSFADTNSMWPVIDDNTKAVIVYDFNSVDVGHIVRVRYKDKSIPHRVDKKESGKRWRTKGINNHFADSYILDESNYQGTIVGVFYARE